MAIPGYTREQAGDLRLDQRRSVILRWWLLASAALAVSSAPTLLGLELPLLPMLAVLLALAGYNAWLQWQMRRASAVPDGELLGQLCVDLTALAVLLYFSGGATNPLISFLLVPVAVAALSLPGRLTAVVALLAVAVYSVLMWRFLPLAVGDAERAARLHLAGMWLTFVASASMIAWFVARMTASIRERDRRLAEAREQALRDERVVALGALAAGAAHELGTPLATIAVLVGELERDAALDAEMRADLAVIRQQVALCKGIISGMVARTGVRRPEQLEVREAVAWLQAVLARWHAMRPRAESRLMIGGGPGVALITVEATLEQAFLNVFNNAADAGRGELRIDLGWTEHCLDIVVCDAGPGFTTEVLQQAGRGPLPEPGGGAGIGLLLAFSAIERLDGRIVLDNPPDGGGRVRIELPLAGLLAA